MVSVGVGDEHQLGCRKIRVAFRSTVGVYENRFPRSFQDDGAVGESGATIFSVLAQKQQNDSEMWYMIDNSLMTTLPDAWGIGERFILLPINHWYNNYRRVNIGGLSCDNSDYYNSEIHESQVYLPMIKPEDEEPLYLGFFHTGAYQDNISGYGGIKHCMIPSPQHIIIDLDDAGNLVDRVLHPKQTAESMLEILGY